MGAGGAGVKVCVQGLWHLGIVTAACLASVGHDVVGLDFSTVVVDALNQGNPPLFEPRLEDLLKQGMGAKRLAFKSDADEAVRGIEVLWIAYDTPVDEDDNADVDFVVAEIEKTLPHLAAGTTVLISSQMPVGSVRRLETIAATRFPGKDLGFAYSPENLRLGKALDVFLKPDRVVVGVRVARDRERIERLLHPITERIEWMSVESAEMTKHAVNAFLATSVTFANEIASICELVGADAKEVERGLKTETRIGPKAYLSPGAAFAGGTLARDISFLNKISGDRDLGTPLLSSIKASNDEHKRWVTRKLQTLIPDLAKATVAVWGLTYKTGTDTLRRSMAVELCDWLVARKVHVYVHDPAVKSLPASWNSKVTQFGTPLGALKGADVLVISTEWPQYKDVSEAEIVGIAPGIAVLDANRFLAHLAGSAGLKYLAVGSPERGSDR
jgi:UDPglucose 6-dehydrogenase